MSLKLVSPPSSDRRDPLAGAVVRADVERDGAVAWLRVQGDLNDDSAPELTRELRRAQMAARLIVLDLRQLASIDAASVGVIARAGVRARRGNRRLILVRAPERIDRVFALIAAGDRPEIVDLEPGAPVVQALLALASKDRVA
jgi:anti-anti-sigma factor